MVRSIQRGTGIGGLLSRLFMAAVVGVSGLMPVSGQALEYRDYDWTTTLFNNCKLPVSDQAATPERPPSVQWVRLDRDYKLAFRLNTGDMGGCSADSQARDSAPFWERAELRQLDYLNQGEAYEIEFEASFADGFVGERETFFQIHGWTKTCNAAPSLMVMFDRRQLTVKVLQGPSERELQADPSAERGSLKVANLVRPNIDNIGRDLNRFTIFVDMQQKPYFVTVAVNGQMVVPGTEFYMQDCAQPHVKMGIYRPGGRSPLSMLVMDNLTIFPFGRISNTLSNLDDDKAQISPFGLRTIFARF